MAWRSVRVTNLFYDPVGHYIAKTNLYFAQPFLNFFFNKNKTSSPETNEFICNDVLKESCGYDIGFTAACVNELNDLPVADDGYVTGNNQGCRALHAVFAQTNQFHCPHVSLSNEDADNNGSIKRSNVTESGDINPEDLFDIQQR